MSGGARQGAGRKPVKIDLEQLEKLCGLQCTDAEIAAWFTSRRARSRTGASSASLPRRWSAAGPRDASPCADTR